MSSVVFFTPHNFDDSSFAHAKERMNKNKTPLIDLDSDPALDPNPLSKTLLDKPAVKDPALKYYNLDVTQEKTNTLVTIVMSAQKKEDSLQLLQSVKTLCKAKASIKEDGITFDEADQRLLEISAIVFNGFMAKFNKQASKIVKKFQNFIANYCCWTKLYKNTKAYNEIKKLLIKQDKPTIVQTVALTALPKSEPHPLSEKPQSNNAEPTRAERRVMYIESHGTTPDEARPTKTKRTPIGNLTIPSESNQNAPIPAEVERSTSEQELARILVRNAPYNSLDKIMFYLNSGRTILNEIYENREASRKLTATASKSSKDIKRIEAPIPSKGTIHQTADTKTVKAPAPSTSKSTAPQTTADTKTVKAPTQTTSSQITDTKTVKAPTQTTTSQITDTKTVKAPIPSTSKSTAPQTTADTKTVKAPSQTTTPQTKKDTKATV